MMKSSQPKRWTRFLATFDKAQRHGGALAPALLLLAPWRSRAEDQVQVMRDAYREDDDRIAIDTTALLIEKRITQSTVAHARYIYDAISGSSPIGTPPSGRSKGVPLAKVEDYRNALNFGIDQQWSAHTLAPQFSYSTEHDYESYGIAYTHAIEFNQKNTKLSVGASHDFDEVLSGDYKREWKSKDTTDAMVGISQVLGPTTVLSANFTGGYSTGYLEDPYKRIAFDSYDPTGQAGFRENRPAHKSRGVGLLTLTQFITPADASVELSYRYHQDSYEINAHTVTAMWNQKIGKRVTISPFVRYYTQDAADFYYARVPAALGDPIAPNRSTPEYFSADYRLSALDTWTLGVHMNFLIGEHVKLELEYKRYEMRGTDGVTSQSAYPGAHVFTAGLAVLF
jgi:hypothetical protein